MFKAIKKINIILLTSFFLLFAGISLFFLFELNQKKEINDKFLKKSLLQLSINLGEPLKFNDLFNVRKIIQKSLLYDYYKNLKIVNSSKEIIFKKNRTKCSKESLGSSVIYYLDEKVGEIFTCETKNYRSSYTLFLFSFGCLIVFMLFIFILIRKQILQNTKPLLDFIREVERIDFNKASRIELSGSIARDKTFSDLGFKINSLLDNLLFLNSKLVEQEKIKNQITLSSQLAHDIRSPLSALDMSIKSLDKVDPSQKQLIRSAINRIHDIANNLVGKNEKMNNDSSVESTLLSSVLSQIISEKRTEYRNLNRISIDFPFSTNEYGLFSEINSYELKRIISNLINNSIEANDKDEGFIEVRLENTADYNQIVISDNGKGISKENIDSIFKEGVSIDKSDGTGLGLFHAKNTIESWSGFITCESELQVSTVFTIRLPKSNSPSSFVKSIEIDSNQNIVIVDDDSSIHQVWKGRLESLKVDTSKLSIFSDPKMFLTWYEANKDENATYLFDFEFLGHELNGLSLVEAVSASNKYLVTSRYEEDHIKNKCSEYSIGLIDKGMIGFIPMSVEIKQEKTLKSHILIDDDDLIHMSWKYEAKKCEVELDCYNTVEEFLAKSECYSKDSIIYVDSNLANDIKGEVESEKIHKAGFSNIYLSTGYAPSDLEKPSWIKEIVGKRAKFN